MPRCHHSPTPATARAAQDDDLASPDRSTQHLTGPSSQVSASDAADMPKGLGPTLSGGAVPARPMPRNDLLQAVEDVGLGRETDDPADFHASCEDNQRRDAFHAVSDG